MTYALYNLIYNYMLLYNWELEKKAIQYLNYVCLDYIHQRKIFLPLLNNKYLLCICLIYFRDQKNKSRISKQIFFHLNMILIIDDVRKFKFKQKQTLLTVRYIYFYYEIQLKKTFEKLNLKMELKQ